MAKRAYIGIGASARKIRKGYVGVEGIARKIQNAYIGINGIARPCWNTGTLAYYGTITPLPSTAYNYMGNQAVSAPAHLVFGGGKPSGYSDAVYAYDSALTLTTATPLGDSTEECFAMDVGEYALFSGGYNGNHLSGSYAYDAELVRSAPADLSSSRHTGGSGGNKNYAIFMGGSDGNSTYHTTTEAFNANLTKQSATATPSRIAYNRGIKTASLAVSAGGLQSGSSFSGSTSVFSYDLNLTLQTHSSLSVGRYLPAGGSVDNYVLVAGGIANQNGIRSAAVDAYDENMVRSTVASLSSASEGAATNIGNYCLVIGNGFANGYDEDLTKIHFDVALKNGTACGHIGDFALCIGGGSADVHAFIVS